MRFCKRGSLDVRFAPKATELLRRREMSRWANKRHCWLAARAVGELLLEGVLTLRGFSISLFKYQENSLSAGWRRKCIR